jgi:hypothetical protein
MHEMMNDDKNNFISSTNIRTSIPKPTERRDLFHEESCSTADYTVADPTLSRHTSSGWDSVPPHTSGVVEVA